jgi:hypothetical protein
VSPITIMSVLRSVGRVNARVAADPDGVLVAHREAQVTPGHSIHRQAADFGAGVDQHRGRRAVERAVDGGHEGGAGIADRQVGHLQVTAAGRFRLGGMGKVGKGRNAGKNGNEIRPQTLEHRISSCMLASNILQRKINQLSTPNIKKRQDNHDGCPAFFVCKH